MTVSQGFTGSRTGSFNNNRRLCLQSDDAVLAYMQSHLACLQQGRVTFVSLLTAAAGCPRGTGHFLRPLIPIFSCNRHWLRYVGLPRARFAACCLLPSLEIRHTANPSSDLLPFLQPDVAPLGAADDVCIAGARQPVSDLQKAASAEGNTLPAETEALATAAVPAPRPWRPRGVRAGRRHKKRHGVSIAHIIATLFGNCVKAGMLL